jgi:hypothetical protein
MTGNISVQTDQPAEFNDNNHPASRISLPADPPISALGDLEESEAQNAPQTTIINQTP